MPLARILDDLESVGLGETRKPAHVSHLSVQVDGHDMGRACDCRSLRLVCVDVVVDIAHVHDDGYAARLDDGLERSREGACWDNHPASWSQPGCKERETKRVESARHADAVI